ncbi:MAG: tetratricopeptide repeat protein [Bdellovibrionales bacterium]|nr:tetratricopeptide repeat protein [Bdellovibrionales bacterium]
MKRVFLPQDFLWFLIPLALAGFLVFFHFFIFSQTWTEKGIEFLKQKKPQSAIKVFLKILEREPFHPYAHLNLGLAYDISGRPKKALKEYGMISKHFNQDSLQFFSSFNMAELHGRLKILDKALENYQQALAFSIESDKIKQNIELLFQTPPPQEEKQDKTKKPKGKQSKSDSGGGQGNQEDQKKEQRGKSSQNKKDSSSSEAKENNEDNKEGGSEDEQPSSDSQSDQGQSRSGSVTPEGDISKRQAQSIMDEIEEQESNVRARQFQQNSLRRPRQNTNKDW